MISSARKLYNAKDLVRSWTERTIRGRYQQSILGWLWAIIQPAGTVIIFTVVFTYFVPVNTNGIPYILFSYTGTVPWTLFANSISEITDSLVGNLNLITKIYFPREALPIAIIFARLLDFGIAGSLLIILIIYFRIPQFLTGWLFLPVILLVEITFLLGLGLACAALNVFYRDVSSLLRLIVQLWFYATPIVYPISAVPEGLRPFYYLNPMAGIIASFRDVLLEGRLPGSYLLVAALISMLTFIVGYWYFKHVEYQFADII